MNLYFFYKECQPNLIKEKVIKRICEKAATFITLPAVLEIEIQNFSSPNYQREYRYVLAETVLDSRLSNNRVRINNELTEKEIVIPLVHELLHVNQIEEGRLSVYRNGDIYWEGKRYQLKDPKRSSYQYYENLPWEVDVRGKEKKLLNNIINNL